MRLAWIDLIRKRPDRRNAGSQESGKLKRIDKSSSGTWLKNLCRFEKTLGFIRRPDLVC